MKKRNFRFAFEIVLTLIIFALLAVANILSGARTTQNVERQIQEARALTETTGADVLGAEWETEEAAAKKP